MTIDEDVRKDIAERICIGCGKCRTLNADCYLAKNISAVLYYAGYRKSPKDAIVLTSEKDKERTEIIPQDLFEKASESLKAFIESMCEIAKEYEQTHNTGKDFIKK